MGGNTEEIDQEHHRTRAHIQQALANPSAAAAQAARTRATMPEANPRSRVFGAPGERVRAQTADSAGPYDFRQVQNDQRVPADQYFTHRRPSAVPLSSPLESDAGAAGSRRSSLETGDNVIEEATRSAALAGRSATSNASFIHDGFQEYPSDVLKAGYQRRKSAVPISSPEGSEAGAAGS